jgi:hypothetical protein
MISAYRQMYAEGAGCVIEQPLANL